VNVEAKKTELAELRQRVQQLEAELLREQASPEPWQPQGFYGSYYATTGFMLGMLAAVASLLVNVVAAPIAGKHPLDLIRVYLTFPLGEKALALTTGGEDVYVVGDGVIVAFGCCLYIATGMVLGMLIHVALSRLIPKAGLPIRLVVASLLATALWAINFYGILAWLQPALFGGNWITDSTVLPWWVAFATHLVFGWTMALIYPWGQYQAYIRPAKAA
jgi:hypothetical protein